MPTSSISALSGPSNALATLARAPAPAAAPKPGASKPVAASARQTAPSPAKPAGAAAAPAYVSETMPARPPAPMPPLPSSQITMLRQLAGIALGEANPVAPGQVTPGQQQVLGAWQQNANSDYSQYMMDRGFTAVADNPGVLFSEEALAAQAQWSSMDAKGALDALGVSAKDWDEYQKLEEQAKKRKMGLIMGAVELVAGAAITYFSGGTLASVGVGMMASGASSMSSS